MTHPALRFLQRPLEHAPQAFARGQVGAHQAATSPANTRKPPTVAQQLAGNYKRGPVTLPHGLPVHVDNPFGTYREGESPDGTKWSNRMAADYGDIVGTRGADGDAVDIFVGPFPESPYLWVINQRKTWGEGGFDEHKVMAGFWTEAQARAAYLGSYDRGWNGLASIVPCTYAQLRWWLRHGDTTKELTPESLPFDEGNIMLDAVQWTRDAEPVGKPLHGLLYELRRADAGAGLLLDAVTMDDLMGDPDIEGIPQLDALVVEAYRMQQKMDRLMAVMEAAGGAVKPTQVSISDPVRLRGVVQVMVLFEMSDGQTISVWFHNPDTTPAKLTPSDELISWKWMLNKRDVTIVVAPERGVDLNVREVARRIMRLVERNSAAFQKANAKAAERAVQVEAVKTEIAGLEVELADLQRQIDRATLARDEAPTPKQRWDAAKGYVRGLHAEVRQELGAAIGGSPALAKVPEAQEANTLLLALEQMAGGQVAADTPEGLRQGAEAQALAIREKLAEAQAKLQAPAAPEPAADPAPPPAADSSDAVLAGLGVAADDIAAMAGDGGYAAIVADDRLALKWQDVLDAALQQRLVDVRNALRELGWSGTETLGKGLLTLEFKFAQVGAGKNVVRYWVEVLDGGERKAEVGDSLTKAAKDVAAQIDAWVENSGEARNPDTTPAPGPTKEEQAYELGKAAFAAGKQRTPALDPGLTPLLAGIQLGDGTETLDAWLRGWDEANLAAPVPVTLAGTELGEFPDSPEGLRELRAAAVTQYEAMLGEWVDCPALGSKVELRKKGLKKVVSSSADPRKLKLLPAIKSLIANGVKVGERAPYDGDTDKSAKVYYTLRSMVNLAGAALAVRVVVKEDVNGQFHYDHTVYAAEAVFDSAMQNGLDEPARVQPLLPMAGEQNPSRLASDQLAPIFDETGAEVNSGSEVLNLFIEGEAPTTVEDELVPAPTDAELEAAAAAGATVQGVATTGDGTKMQAAGEIPLAHLRTEDGFTSIALWTAEDVIRARGFVHEAQRQSKFRPFDPSTLRMPTAVQLGVPQRGILIVTKEAVASGKPTDGDILPGWSNGHMLDLVQRPVSIQKAIDKNRRRGFIGEAAVEKVVAAAKDRASHVEPISHFDDGSMKSVVLASSAGDPWVWIDTKYLAYFWKTYRGAEFYVDGPTDSVAVRHQGKLVGVIMPMRTKAAGDTDILARAKRAVGAVGPVAEPKGEDVADGQIDPIAAVDAAYVFQDATDDFKRAVAETVHMHEYSEFLSAKSIDERARSHGLSVSWALEAMALDAVSTGEPDTEGEASAALFDAADLVLDDAGGAYLGKPQEAIAATAKLLKYFRDFIRSDKELAVDPTSGWVRSTMSKADAQRMLTQMIDIAVNRKGGTTLTLKQEDEYADFVHDARVINDYLHKRIRSSGSRGMLRHPKMKALYPQIDNQPSFDAVAAAAAPYLSKGMALDSTAGEANPLEPESWLGYRVVDQAYVDQQQSTMLPSAHHLSGQVWLSLGSEEKGPLFVAGRVVGITFNPGKVLYSVAMPIAPQPKEGVTLYAVIHAVPSELVLGDVPGASVLDAVGDDLAARLGEVGAVEPAPALLDFAGDVSASIAQLQIALDVVTTNEPINRARGDIDQADLEARNAEDYRRAIAYLAAGHRPVLDDASGWEPEPAEYIVGKIKRGADVIGRAVIDSDGKAMVYLGPEGTKRVTFVSPVDGERRTPMWSDDDAGEMVDWLLENTSAPAAASGGGQPPADPPAPPVDASEPERKHEPASLQQGRAALRQIAEFMPRSQRAVIEEAMAGEEGQWFIDKAVALRDLIVGMPKNYEQADMGDQALVYLHYFRGSADWHITEKDREQEQVQAFGLANLGHGAELGYISIEELVRNGVELDLHWEPKTLAAIQGEGPAPTAVADPNIGRKWASREGEVEIVGYFNDDKSRYATTVDGKVGGAPIIPVAELEAYIDLDVRNAEARAESLQEIAEQEARDAVKAAEAQDTDGFADQFSELKRGKVIAHLSAPRAYKGAETSIKTIVREMVAAGATVDQLQSGERILKRPDDSFLGEKQLGATGIDYAAYLLGKQGERSAAPGEQPSQDADRAYLQTLIDGTADMMDAGILDRLEPMFTKYEADEPMMALLNAAANAYAAAAEKAARDALNG